jgi:hypothetical protein
MTAFLLGALGFLRRIPWQVWALLGAGLFLLGLVQYGRHWHGEALKARAQVSLDCAAARKSANNPKMACDQTDEQIGFMGDAIGTLTTAILKQNDAVSAMGAETKRQQAEASEAVSKAQGRALAAQATSTRLIASSRSGEAQAKPCEPSKVLKGAWQ